MKSHKPLVILLAAVLSAVGLLCYWIVDMTGAPYSEIEAYREAHPHRKVIYQVEVTGGETPLVLTDRSDSVLLTHPAQAESLAEQADYLQQLAEVQVQNWSIEAETLALLREAFPNAVLHYPELSLLGMAYPSDSTHITLDGLTEPQLREAAATLPWFPQLETLGVNAPQDSLYTAQQAAILAQAIPEVRVQMSFDLFGQEVSTDAERLEYFKVDIGDEGLDTIRSVMPLMDKLSYLKLDWCGTSNEATAQLRDDYADQMKVVWRVFFGDFNALTDTYKIWAQFYLWSRDVEVLKYCTEVRYIDMGHSYVDSCEFVRYMPYLDTLILGDSSLLSLEPLRTCKNLTYLEIFTCRVTDLSPLADLPQLEYLNISNIETTDISPLYGLHNLKKLNSTMNEKIPRDQIAKFKELNPDCDATFTFADESPTEYGWRRAPAPPYGIYLYTPRYALLRQQIGYDTRDYSRYPKGYLTEEVTYESTGILPPEEYYKEENYE